MPNNHKRVGISGWYKLRWEILERDKFTCQYCGRSSPDVKLEVDHKMALCDGGTDDKDNLVCSCYACNRGKSGLRQSIVLSKTKSDGHKKISIPDMVLDIIKKNPQGLRPCEMARLVGMPASNIGVTAYRLKDKGVIEKRGLKYYLKGSKVSPVACPTCRDKKWLEIKTDDKVTYEPCPDCSKEKNLT